MPHTTSTTPTTRTATSRRTPVTPEQHQALHLAWMHALWMAIDGQFPGRVRRNAALEALSSLVLAAGGLDAQARLQEAARCIARVVRQAGGHLAREDLQSHTPLLWEVADALLPDMVDHIMTAARLSPQKQNTAVEALMVSVLWCADLPADVSRSLHAAGEGRARCLAAGGRIPALEQRDAAWGNHDDRHLAARCVLGLNDGDIVLDWLRRDRADALAHIQASVRAMRDSGGDRLGGLMLAHRLILEALTAAGAPVLAGHPMKRLDPLMDAAVFLSQAITWPEDLIDYRSQRRARDLGELDEETILPGAVQVGAPSSRAQRRAKQRALRRANAAD